MLTTSVDSVASRKVCQSLVFLKEGYPKGGERLDLSQPQTYAVLLPELLGEGSAHNLTTKIRGSRKVGLSALAAGRANIWRVEGVEGQTSGSCIDGRDQSAVGGAEQRWSTRVQHKLIESSQ